MCISTLQIDSEIAHWALFFIYHVNYMSVFSHFCVTDCAWSRFCIPFICQDADGVDNRHKRYTASRVVSISRVVFEEHVTHHDIAVTTIEAWAALQCTRFSSFARLQWCVAYQGSRLICSGSLVSGDSWTMSAIISAVKVQLRKYSSIFGWSTCSASNSTLAIKMESANRAVKRLRAAALYSG